jgi:uncharacterized protein with PIN domain
VPVVLDASAMIAFLRDEPGAATVMDHIQRFPQAVSAHSLNLCEVYEFWRSSGKETAQSAIDDLLILGITERSDLDLILAPWHVLRQCIGVFPSLIAQP